MKSSKTKIPNLTNPVPGGYWTGNLWLLADGQVSSRNAKGARFLGNLFVVDKEGQVWLGVRRSVWPVKGALSFWYAVKIEAGKITTGTPAPGNWRDYVCAALVIPLLSTVSGAVKK